MRADWETAFENCPPYGEGKGAYTQEDFTCMMEMERNMEALLHWLESEGSFFFSIQFNKLADMDIVLIVFSVLFMIVGLLGCILPTLPGPPLSYIGFLLLHFTDRVQFSTTQILILLLLVVVAQVIDYFIKF